MQQPTEAAAACSSESESDSVSDSVGSEETPDGMFGCLLMLLAWHRNENGCMVLPSSARTPT